jgi:hypothetical protein
MAHLIRDLDPTFVLAVLIPLGALAAGWALQMACSICSVEPPDFWKSVLAVVVICISNIVLRFWLRVTETPANFGTQVFAAAVITALVIAMSIRTGPSAAFKVTCTHGVLCGLIYCVVSAMGKALIVGVV